MKSGQNVSAEAVCPYYNKEAASGQIFCEFVPSVFSLTLNCCGRDNFAAYKGKFCYALPGYLDCPICQMLNRINGA